MKNKYSQECRLRRLSGAEKRQTTLMVFVDIGLAWRKKTFTSSRRICQFFLDSEVGLGRHGDAWPADSSTKSSAGCCETWSGDDDDNDDNRAIVNHDTFLGPSSFTSVVKTVFNIFFQVETIFYYCQTLSCEDGDLAIVLISYTCECIWEPTTVTSTMHSWHILRILPL